MKGRKKSIGIQVILLLTVWAALACGGNKPPEGVLRQDEMVSTMIDIYLSEEKLNVLSLKRDSAEKVFDRMKEKIFAANNTQDEQFRRSMDYYMDHPKEWEQILTTLVDSLQLKEQRLFVQPEKKK